GKPPTGTTGNGGRSRSEATCRSETFVRADRAPRLLRHAGETGLLKEDRVDCPALDFLPLAAGIQIPDGFLLDLELFRSALVGSRLFSGRHGRLLSQCS